MTVIMKVFLEHCSIVHTTYTTYIHTSRYTKDSFYCSFVIRLLLNLLELVSSVGSYASNNNYVLYIYTPIVKNNGSFIISRVFIRKYRYVLTNCYRSAAGRT